jgi:hypothetical protein
MRAKAVLFASALAAAPGLLGQPAVAAPETICGWFDNPTPGNASLWDKDGEWTIGVQGDFQADGDWPGPFGSKQWVSSGNADYGYGCACVTAELDHDQQNVLKIVSSKVKPLSACRKDPALKQFSDQFK